MALDPRYCFFSPVWLGLLGLGLWLVGCKKKSLGEKETEHRKGDEERKWTGSGSTGLGISSRTNKNGNENEKREKLLFPVRWTGVGRVSSFGVQKVAAKKVKKKLRVNESSRTKSPTKLRAKATVRWRS